MFLNLLGYDFLFLFDNNEKSIFFKFGLLIDKVFLFDFVTSLFSAAISNPLINTAINKFKTKKFPIKIKDIVKNIVKFLLCLEPSFKNLNHSSIVIILITVI